MNEKNEPSTHVNQRFCTFVREDVDNLPALCAFRCPVFQSVSCREERPEVPMWKTQGRGFARRGIRATMRRPIEGRPMQYTEEELREARRQIESTLHKVRETLATLEAKPNADRLKPQITLARRRIAAFSIAVELIDERLAEKN